MAFITKNVAKFADNVLGIDRPDVAPIAPTNTSIPTSTLAGGKNNDNIRGPSSERSRSDALGAYGSGQSGIALDPLGKRGGGFISGQKTMLGR